MSVYFTRIFFPALMLLPLILFSFFSFETVVWLRSAISLKVSPSRTETFLAFRVFFLLFFLPFPFLLLFFDELSERWWVFLAVVFCSSASAAS